MVIRYRIIICLWFVLDCSINIHSQENHNSAVNSPLRIERDSSGDSYYWIDNYALDFNKFDYSKEFETYLTPLEDRIYEDCTQQFIDGKLQLDQNFFQPDHSYDGNPYDAPVNGFIGNDFKRIEVYSYPGVVKIDSLTFSIRGRTKVEKNVCDFEGEITIKKIYHVFVNDTKTPEDYFIIIAKYDLKEDKEQKGSGKFQGIFGAYGYICNDYPGIIMVDNRSYDADGYMNRSFVGVWQSNKNTNLVKRCVWGDYRLPFSFDFDIGAGEIGVNPKYAWL